MGRMGILLADLFDEREFVYPYYRVEEAGYAPVVIGPEAREYRGKSGLAWRAEVAAREAPELQGLLIPGGVCPGLPAAEPGGALPGAPGGGGGQAPGGHLPRGLGAGECRAGARPQGDGVFLHPGRPPQRRGLYQEEGVVVDGNLVTAQGPRDLPAFMRAFLGLLPNG